MHYEHVDDVSLHTYIDTYIGTANLPYVTLVFGVHSGSPRIRINIVGQLALDYMLLS